MWPNNIWGLFFLQELQFEHIFPNHHIARPAWIQWFTEECTCNTTEWERAYNHPLVRAEDIAQNTTGLA